MASEANLLSLSQPRSAEAAAKPSQADGEFTVGDTIRAPVMLCGVMVAIGLFTAFTAGVNGTRLFWDYTWKGIVITVIAMLVWVFLEIAKLGRVLADRPLATVWRRLPKRLELLVLPCFVFPIFLAGFTTAKTSIHFLVGFRWDRFWADADRALFRTDPWQITHSLLGSFATDWWAWIYTFVWGGILAYTKSFVAIYGSRRFVATFYTAMLSTWIVGGWMMAYCFSAAGPVFAHLYDPGFQPRFEPLRQSLDLLLAQDNAVRTTQAYLSGAVEQLTAVRGGGISAMPSMHLGACTIYVCAARGTRWLVPAIAFWLVIFIGSVHFGYHYAIDGIAAAIIAALCWKVSGYYYTRRAARAGQGVELAAGPRPALALHKLLRRRD